MVLWLKQKRCSGVSQQVGRAKALWQDVCHAVCSSPEEELDGVLQPAVVLQCNSSHHGDEHNSLSKRFCRMSAMLHNLAKQELDFFLLSTVKVQDQSQL